MLTFTYLWISKQYQKITKMDKEVHKKNLKQIDMLTGGNTHTTQNQKSLTRKKYIFLGKTDYTVTYRVTIVIKITHHIHVFR